VLRVSFDGETFAQRSIGLRAIGCEKFKERVAKSLKDVLNKHRRSVCSMKCCTRACGDTPRTIGSPSASSAREALPQGARIELGLSSDRKTTTVLEKLSATLGAVAPGMRQLQVDVVKVRAHVERSGELTSVRRRPSRGIDQDAGRIVGAISSSSD